MRSRVRDVTVIVNLWSRISLYSSLLNSCGFQVFFKRLDIWTENKFSHEVTSDVKVQSLNNTKK